MAKILCHLLMKVNHVIVANFYVTNMSFNAIRENKVLAKISKFTVKKKVGSHISMLYPNPCYNEVCYKGTALYKG